MLIDILCKDAIQLGLEAKTWQEAIQVSAQPLVDANKIEGRYIDSIIGAVEKHGPYFVLIPHVALAHARPEDGAIENSIGITVLKEGVRFGNEANDPVQYIFTLSAVNDENHLEALSQLAVLFEDQKFFSLLDHSENYEEIVNYIKEES